MQLTYISLVSFLWVIEKTVWTQIRRRKNAASDQGIHCLLIESTIKIDYTFLYAQRIPTTLRQSRKTVHFSSVVGDWLLYWSYVFFVNMGEDLVPVKCI